MIAAPWYLSSLGIVLVIVGALAGAVRGAGQSRMGIDPRLTDAEIAKRLDRRASLGFPGFMVYAGLLGLMLSSVFLAYTGASVTRVFFISAASFGALSLYGYTTQRDLSAIGSFMMMGLIGLIIAMLVNMFLKSTGLDFVISAAGVLIFAGLTAWDTQRIKEMYDPMEDGTIVGRKAVMGALSLYLDFINIFLFLLRLMGDRR